MKICTLAVADKIIINKYKLYKKFMCNQTTYERAIEDLEQIISHEEIDTFLDNLSNRNAQFRCIVNAIRSERQLPVDSMIDILQYMLRNMSHEPESDTEDTENLEIYQRICRSHRRTVEMTNSSTIQYYGTAVYKSTFISRIIRANRSRFVINFDPDELKHELERTLISYTNDPNSEQFKEGELDGSNNYTINDAERNMWATWGESSDPFDFMRTRDSSGEGGSACEVGLSLALSYDDRKIRTENMWLLTYDATGITCYVPTIADAEGYEYFSPCPESSDYGLTNPAHHDLRYYYINQCLTYCGYSNYNDQARPEAIHRPITIRCLQRIEELLIPGIG